MGGKFSKMQMKSEQQRRVCVTRKRGPRSESQSIAVCLSQTSHWQLELKRRQSSFTKVNTQRNACVCAEHWQSNKRPFLRIQRRLLHHNVSFTACVCRQKERWPKLLYGEAKKNISKACEHIPVFSELWTQFRKGKVRNQNFRLLNSRHESAPFTRVEILSHSLVKLKSLAFKTPRPNYQLAKHFNHTSERVFEEEICRILTKLSIGLIYSFRRRV